MVGFKGFVTFDRHNRIENEFPTVDDHICAFHIEAAFPNGQSGTGTEFAKFPERTEPSISHCFLASHLATQHGCVEWGLSMYQPQPQPPQLYTQM